MDMETDLKIYQLSHELRGHEDDGATPPSRPLSLYIYL